MKKLLVIIPAYNEEAAILNTIADLCFTLLIFAQRIEYLLQTSGSFSEFYHMYHIFRETSGSTQGFMHLLAFFHRLVNLVE